MAAIPLMANTLVVDTVPSFRSPMPVLTPLPALELFAMFKQTEVFVQGPTACRS